MATGAGAISIVVSSDNAQFDAAMPRSAAIAEQSFSRMSRAQQAAQKDGDAFVQSIQRQVDAFGLSGTALLRYQAGLKGVSDSANPLIDRLERLQDAQAAFNAAATSGSGLQQVGKGFGDAANGADKASHGTASITRELLILGHEASQGNWKRLGGSLMVLGELGFSAAAGILAAWAPVIALGAAVLALGAAIYSGAEASKKQQDALQLTGNYAGQTAQSLRAMGEDISRINSQPIGKVNEAMQEVVASGRVSGDAIKSVTAAAVSVSKLTGESAGEVAKRFSEMTSNVGASAAKLSETYHFLDGATLATINSMTAQGRTSEALALAMDKLNAKTRDQVSEQGFLGTAFKQNSIWASEFWNWLQKLGKPADTGTKLVDAQKTLADLQAQRANLPTLHGTNGDFQPGANAIDAQIADQKRIVDALKDRSAYEASAAKNAAELARRQDAEVRNQQAAAQDAASSLQQAGINQRLAQAALGREKEQVELEKGYEQGKVSLAAYIDAEYSLRKRALQDQLTAVGQEAALLKLKPPTTPEEVTAQSAKQLDILNRRYAIEAQLVKLEEQKRTTPQAFEPANVQDSIHTPQEDFNRSEHSAATQEAIAAAIRSQDEAAAAFIKTLKEQAAATDKEVDALDAELATLGMSSIEKQKALAVSKLQAQADKDSLQPGADKAAILASQAAQTEKLTAAMDRNYAASRSFDTGAKTAFQTYQDSASNAGKFAENVIGGGLDKLTDALVKFEETGKLSFRDLFTFMAEEFLKQLVRMQVASAAAAVTGASTGSSGNLFGTLFSAVGSYFGFGSSGAGGQVQNGYASAAGISGGRASGGPVMSGQSYVVGERGPEVLTMGANTGFVTPNGGGRGSGMNVVINAPPGTKVDKTTESHGQDGHQLEVFLSMAEKRSASNVAKGRGPMTQALQSRGVNTNAQLPRRA